MDSPEPCTHLNMQINPMVFVFCFLASNPCICLLLCLPVARIDSGSGPCPLWSRSCLGALIASHGTNHRPRTDGLQMSIFLPRSPGLTHLVSYQTSPLRSLTDISNLISQIKPLIFTPSAWKWCNPHSLLMPQYLNHSWSSFPSLPSTSSPMANLSVLPSKLYLASGYLSPAVSPKESTTISPLGCENNFSIGLLSSTSALLLHGRQVDLLKPELRSHPFPSEENSLVASLCTESKLHPLSMFSGTLCNLGRSSCALLPCCLASFSSLLLRDLNFGWLVHS